MKKILLICSILFLGSQLLIAQTSLNAGDIAFVGYNSDGSDDFAFVLLTDIDSGTIIKFTDNGWFNNTIGFTSANGDSIITWTTSTALITGAVVHIEGAVASQGTITSGAGLDLNSFGDQILAYQGTDNINANFISAIHMNIANGTDDANWDNTGSTNFDDESNLPNGLTNGVNAFRGYNTAVGDIEIDNIIYNCINTNTIDIPSLRASLNDILNWNADNFNPFTLNPFSCTFESDTCSNITNFLATSSATGTNADLTWDIVTEATSGYLVEVYNAGEDPTMVTPLFTENLAAGTTVSTVIGLTQYNLYDAYITADCGAANGVSEIATITFEASACPRVTSLFLNNVGETSVSIGWSILPEATAGYNIEIYLAGADPAVDAPVATGAGASQTGGLFFENLTPGTFYDAYVTSDCGANGLAAAESFTFATLTSCPIVSNLMGSNIADTSINVTWDNIPEATNGYTLEVYNAGENPNSTAALMTESLPAGTTSFVVTGLMAVTYYDIYVGSSCDVSIGDSIPVGLTFRTTNAPFICGNNFYDPGGPFEDYPEVFSGAVTISPDVVDEVVTVTFTYVDIDAANGNPQIDGGCLDYLRVYDGPDTSSPVIAMFLCGEESGSGQLPPEPSSILSVGDSFTSTHPSGALTFEFIVPIGGFGFAGWEADITCAPTLLSVDEFSLTSFSFSPNPTNGKVTFKSSNNNIDSIEVFDLLGKKVLEANPNSQEFIIDLTNIKPGMYIVKSKIGNKITTKKLIKN